MGRAQVGLTESSYTVLGLLTFGARSGYDLLKLGKESVGGFHRMPSKAQVYEELRKLEAAGLADSTPIEQADRPDKRLYEITSAGRSSLRSWLRDVAAPPLSGLSLLVIFLGAQLPKGALIERLLAIQAEAEERVANLRAIDERLEGKQRSLHPRLVARSGIAQYEACAQWAAESVRELSTSRGS